LGATCSLAPEWTARVVTSTKVLSLLALLFADTKVQILTREERWRYGHIGRDFALRHTCAHQKLEAWEPAAIQEGGGQVEVVEEMGGGRWVGARRLFWGASTHEWSLHSTHTYLSLSRWLHLSDA